MNIPNAEHWGLRPVLFHTGSIHIEAYPLLVFLGVVVGLLVYYQEAQSKPAQSENSIYVLIAAIVGGVLGAKIPIWVMQYHAIAHLHGIAAVLAGRTVVGGLIGGTLAVILVRRKLGITEKTGNLFAPALAIGLGIGRIGCLLRGCCYGMPTSLPWGINLGNGVLRHPTQIYEALFFFALFGYLQWAKRHITEPGRLFAIFMMAYFTFRFFIEFIRAGDPPVSLGLTSSQLAAIGVVGYYVIMGYFTRRPAIQEDNIHGSAEQS